MNFPDFLRSIWTDPRFQKLPEPTRLFLYAALSQVDQAGWWAPNPRLITLEIQGLNLEAATRELNPWLQTHPTGWVSLKGYVALQLGGTELSARHDNFAKGMKRVLEVHQRRELAAGADSSWSPEGLGPFRGGVEPSNPVGKVEAEEGQGRVKLGSVSPKSHAPSPQVSKPQVPPGGPGEDPAPTPPHGDKSYADVVNLFTQLSGHGSDSGLDVPPWTRDALHRAGAKWGWETVYKAAGRFLVGAAGGHGFALKDFVDQVRTLVRKVCDHEHKTWWCFPVETQYPNGIQRRRWRCHLCGHSEEKADSDFLPEYHSHVYTLQEGPGLVLDEDGSIVSVPRWEACVGPDGCGHHRAAVSQEVHHEA